MLDEVLIPRRAALDAYTSPVLRPVFSERSPLDISEMRDSNHHILIRIEVLRIEFLGRHRYLRTSRITELLFQFHRLLLDNLHLPVITCKDLLTETDEFHQFVKLVLEFLPLKASELAEPHLHNSRSLRFCKAIACNEFISGILSGL